MRILIGLFAVVFLTISSGTCINAAEIESKITAPSSIQNHAFGVIYDGSRQIYIYIHNNNCIGTYRVVIGDMMIGEGTVDFNNTPTTIPVGTTSIHIRCGGADRLLIRY